MQEIGYELPHGLAHRAWVVDNLDNPRLEIGVFP